ncbi:MAG: hypothetical protein K2I40_03870, partial [Bifidobacterium castoris]|nr:hypothetical protein [Bifidobacterium castoris]
MSRSSSDRGVKRLTSLVSGCAEARPDAIRYKITKIKLHTQVICYNLHTDFTLAIMADPAMPEQDASFGIRVACGKSEVFFYSDEIPLVSGHYLVPVYADDFSEPGELRATWEDLDSDVQPALFATGRAFVGEPREAHSGEGQVAVLKAEVDKLSQDVSDNASAIAGNTAAIASLDTCIGAITTDLAARMTGQEWLEAIDEGFRQRDVILSNMKRCHNSIYDHDGLKVYYIKEWTTTPTYNRVPYVVPPIEFPELAEGEEFSMQFMFAFCDKLLHVAPMKVPGISLRNTFHGTGLVKAPALDTSSVKIFSAALMNTPIREWPEWDMSKATDLSSIVQECKSLQSVPDLDLPAVTDMKQWLWNCPAIVRIGAIKAPVCADLYMSGLAGIEYVGELDYGQLQTSDRGGVDRQWYLVSRSSAPKLRYLRIIHLGQSPLADYMLDATQWGDG